MPLRTVANLVGVDVDYDANSNTAIIENSVFSNHYDFENGIRSIVLYEYGQFGSQYEVYNIKPNFEDLGGSKHSLISNEELMKIKNISETDINNRVNQYIDDCVLRAKTMWGFSEEELNDFSEKLKEINAISRVNIFINDEDKISLVVHCPDGRDLWAFSEVIDL